MARLLTQLFEVTAQFNMQTQPQLLLLQKTMVVVEGVARTLNPHLNMWVTAEPVVRGWIERKLGPTGRLEDATGSLGGFLLACRPCWRMRGAGLKCCPTWPDSGGIRLDSETTEQLARAQNRHQRWTRFWLATAAIALVVIAVRLVT